MKILRITSLGYESGGAETGIVLTNEVLRARGHEVRVIASDAGPADVRRFSDVTYRACSHHSFLGKIFVRLWNPDAYRVVRREIKSFAPDVIQVHTTYEASASVLFATSVVPAIFTVHGAEDYTRGLLVWGFPQRFFRDQTAIPSARNLSLLGMLHYLYHALLSVPLYRRGMWHVDRVLVMSTYMLELLHREGVEATCIPNATKLFRPSPLPEERTTVLYVGRLEFAKGVHHLLTAFPEVRKHIPTARLVVAGTGSYERELRTLATELGLGSAVRFVGYRTRDDLYALYKQSTLVVMPSIWPEPFGKVGVEAMSVGRPVVATGVGGMSEWLRDGVTGYLVPPGDPHVLATSVTALLKNRTVCESMAFAAAGHATLFSIEQYTTRLEALYQEAIAEHRRQVIRTTSAAPN